jgi:DHA1 family multidrug resistance protein-like MFS transporter
MAYISDSTELKDRGGGMGIIGAAMGIGMIIGPGIGGWLAGDSLSTPFFLAAAMSGIAMLMIIFVLPESLPVEKRLVETGRPRGIQLSVLTNALFGPIGFVLFLAFLVNFALAGFEGIFGLYADQRFDYGPAQVGSILMVIGLITSIVQMFLTGPATRRLGEPLVIKLSLAGSVLGFLLMVIANTTTTVLLTVAFFVFANAMLRPAIMSLTSKLTREGQGMALGLNNSFQSLGRVAGPLWAGFTFDYNLIFPYLSSAVIMFVSLLYSLSRMTGERVQIEQPAPPAPVAYEGGED